jgi:hypothetical protein
MPGTGSASAFGCQSGCQTMKWSGFTLRF